MKNQPLFLGIGLFVGVFVCFSWATAHSQAKEPVVTAQDAAPVASVVDVTVATPAPANVSAPAPVTAPQNDTSALANYLEESMKIWNRGPMAGKATHLDEIASDIAAVVTQEPKIWEGSDGSREGILLARIGWFETRFRDYVDEGLCQVWAKKCYRGGGLCDMRKLTNEQASLMSLGTCDGGYAYTILQIHYPYAGIALMPDGSWHNADYKTTTPRMIIKDVDGSTESCLNIENEADRKTCRSEHRRNSFRVGLAMARQSIKAGVGLRNYVGGEGPERNHMAHMRYDSAVEWSKKHPFVR